MNDKEGNIIEESVFENIFSRIKDIESIIPFEFGDDPRIAPKILAIILKIQSSLTSMLNPTDRLAYQQPWRTCLLAVSNCESFVLDVMRKDYGSETNSRTLREHLQEIKNALDSAKAKLLSKQ